MSLRSFAKKILPAKIKSQISDYLMLRRERHLGRLPLQHAFNTIYKREMWQAAGNTLSGTGSQGPMAERYISFVKAYAEAHKLRTVVDGGCGDFSVGSRLSPSFERYLGLDVSSRIIEINRRLQSSQWRRALITEHVHDPDNNQRPNLDLPSHTARTRLYLGSGVFLDKPPFSLRANRLATIYASADGSPEATGLLVLELSRDAN